MEAISLPVTERRQLLTLELERANLRAQRYVLIERRRAYQRLRTGFADAALSATLVLASFFFWYDGDPGGYYVLAGLAGICSLIALAAWKGVRLRSGQIRDKNAALEKHDARIIEVDDMRTDRLRLRELEEARDDLKLRIKSQLLFRNLLMVLVMIAVAGAAAMVFLYSGRARGYIGLVVVVLVLVGILQITRERTRELEADRRQIDYEIAVISSNQDLKPETLFLKQGFELKRYYDQALRQGGLVFTLGVVALLIGAAIVGGAFWAITERRADQWTAAALGAIGGLASNLVAFVYLRMHSRSVQLVAEFHERLSRYQAGHFGNLLAFELKEGRDELIRNLALANLRLEEAAIDAETVRPDPGLEENVEATGRRRRARWRKGNDAPGR